ncbi:MAG: phage exclusion protein Lit family protein [Thermoguttaceae bacterium]|jgi:hypothetical protein|nr:phage exclusion protein Lit family protein [Thermoguttaceae bacterium]
MSQNEQVSIEPIRKLLRTISLNRAADVDALLDELKPVCELDRQSEQNLFWSRLGTPNVIGMGLTCSVRLQAHAYAAGVIITAIGTPGFKTMPKPERDKLFAPANRLLTWAVGVDVTRWLKLQGINLEPGQVLQADQSDLPNDVLGTLSGEQRILGEGLFWYACAWILLHELGHLKFGHTYTEGYPSLEQEKEADRFAAEWMSESASGSSGNIGVDRLNALFGIAVALLWLTVFNVYFGQKESRTHPQGYDRLSQVLDQVIEWSNEEEHQMVWYFVSTMLFIHMWSAGYDFDESDAIHMQGDPKDEVNYLIDRISRFERKK